MTDETPDALVESSAMTTDFTPRDGGIQQAMVPKESAGRRLTQRQHDDIAEGIHPLTRGPLHPHWLDPGVADDFPTPKDRIAERPFTCGGCAWRAQMQVGKKVQWKCGQQGGAYISHGPATNVPGWWPGCENYKPL